LPEKSGFFKNKLPQRRKGAKRYRVSGGFLCALASLREKIFLRRSLVFLRITPAKAQSATAFLEDFFAPWRLCGKRFSFAEGTFRANPLN
jgi:hypothetical protein